MVLELIDMPFVGFPKIISSLSLVRVSLFLVTDEHESAYPIKTA